MVECVYVCVYVCHEKVTASNVEDDDIYIIVNSLCVIEIVR